MQVEIRPEDDQVEEEQRNFKKDEVYHYMDARLKIASEGNYLHGGGGRL